MLPPRPMQRTEYKKPARINVVSITIFLILGGVVYVGYCMWPVVILRTAAKDELNAALPQIYRANIRPKEQVAGEVVRIRKMVIENLRKQGIKDKDLLIEIKLGKKVVAAEAHFVVNVFFPGLDKNRDIPVDVHVETDAERIEW